MAWGLQSTNRTVHWGLQKWTATPLFPCPHVPTASFPLQKAAFQDANVCLFVFDCIYFNDVSLMDR